MEPVSIYAMTGALGSVMGSPPTNAIASWIGNKYMKWRLRRRIFGCLVLKGKTTICSKITSMTHLALDIDTLYEKYTVAQDAASQTNQTPSPLENYTVYPLLRNHVLQASNLFKGKIILVSSSLELLKAMPIYFNNIHFFPFSKAMEENIGVIFPNERDHHESQLNKFRYLREIEPSNITVVESLIDLEKKVKDHYGITQIAL